MNIRSGKITKSLHVWTGAGVIFLMLAYPGLFFVRGFLGAYLMPQVTSFIRICTEVIVLFSFVFISFIFIKNAPNKKERVKVGIGALCAGTLLFFLALANAFIWSFGEDIRPVVVQGRTEQFIISNIPSIPEGEGFVLYETYFGIFRNQIARSSRWHRGMDSPQVPLHRPGEKTTIFTYDMNTGMVYTSND